MVKKLGSKIDRKNFFEHNKISSLNTRVCDKVKHIFVVHYKTICFLIHVWNRKINEIGLKIGYFEMLDSQIENDRAEFQELVL